MIRRSADIAESLVPIPIFSALKNVETVAIPTVKSAISTFASGVKLVAVVAVPVTSPTIPPMKLDAETALAVRIPTTTSGDPTRLSAPVAIPVRLPVTFPVRFPEKPPLAVIIPETWKASGILELSRIGNLSLLIVQRPMFAPSISVISEPIPLKEKAVTIPVA